MTDIIYKNQPVIVDDDTIPDPLTGTTYEENKFGL